jgi:hypothetical protein
MLIHYSGHAAARRARSRHGRLPSRAPTAAAAPPAISCTSSHHHRSQLSLLHPTLVPWPKFEPGSPLPMAAARHGRRWCPRASMFPSSRPSSLPMSTTNSFTPRRRARSTPSQPLLTVVARDHRCRDRCGCHARGQEAKAHLLPRFDLPWVRVGMLALAPPFSATTYPSLARFQPPRWPPLFSVQRGRRKDLGSQFGRREGVKCWSFDSSE